MEKEIILRAKQGNRGAFDSLVKTYFPRLYRAAYMLLYNIDDAPDICQDALLKAYNHLNKFDERRPFYPWVYTILKNLCINHNKKYSRVKSMPCEYIESIESGYSNPERDLIRKNEASRLKTAISRLPENFKEIIILKNFNNHSYEEISKILDIPKGTVMSRLYNARVKLRNILKEMEGGE